MFPLGRKELRDIIQARLSRTIIYLQRYSKELPSHLSDIRNQLEHPISELHILTKQLSNQPYRPGPPSFSPPEGGIPEDINYFDLALNEIKTASLYFKQRETSEIFEEISDYYLEQKILNIILHLEKIQAQLS